MLATWKQSGGNPSLDLLFNGGIDSRITFSRNSNATYVNSSGIVSTASANVARIDYDKSTLALNGLLLESQSTNLCLQSNALATTPWVVGKNGAGGTCVVTNNYATGPDGTQSASRVQASLGGGTTTSDLSYVVQGITSGGASAGSFWLKTTDGSSQTVYVRGNSDKSITIDGTWRKYEFSAGTLTGSNFGIGVRGGFTPACSNTIDIQVWGAQLEVGAFATSTIPTATASATRLADEPVMSGSNFSSWFNATEGTLIAEFAELSTGLSGNKKTIAALSSGNYNNEIYLGIDSGVNGRVRNANGGTAQFDFIFTSSVSAATFYKIAGAYKANNSNAAQGGVVKTANTTGAIPSLSFLDIGSSAQNSSGSSNAVGDQLNGWVRRLTYYPLRLPDATLQALTT